MSMCSPECFIDEIKEKTYEELIKERDKIFEEIQYFEKNRDVLTNERIGITPSIETVYWWNLQVMGFLCKLISDKFDEDEEIIN